MGGFGARLPDLDPRRHGAGQIADEQGGIVGAGEALREGDALRVLETVREHARHHVLIRLGRLLRHLEREGLVDAAVGVGEIDVEVVDRGSKRHDQAAVSRTGSPAVITSVCS